MTWQLRSSSRPAPRRDERGTAPWVRLTALVVVLAMVGFALASVLL
jgi:hypothetical protein